ncbi:MAG: A/G-specific adenine glycosylase [Myxococcota bacterium]
MSSEPESELHRAGDSVSDRADIARRIVEYFAELQRDLPWRQTRDPYAIWISEIMLQQTRVTTVIPYYRRWLARFPTIRALAQAPLDDVLAAWSGLGYYSRARNLHRCARELVEHHGGVLPDSVEALLRLPGIGRYTAGAVASIAFGRRAPVVDGNVARVLARLYALELDIKSSAGQRELWRLAEGLVPAGAPGDFNQGLMELGATVCTPTRPGCLLCPIAASCRARAAGQQDALPITPRRKRASELPVLAASALWIVKSGRLLLARRAPAGLYGGLWELPQHSATATQRATVAQSELQAVLPDSLTLEVLDDRPAAEHRQILSHRQLRIQVFRGAVRGRLPARSPGRDPAETYDSFAWHTPDQLAERGLSSATQAIIETFREKYGWNRKPAPKSCSTRPSTRSSTA